LLPGQPGTEPGLQADSDLFLKSLAIYREALFLLSEKILSPFELRYLLPGG
jgi:hypothetical protein